MEEEIVTTVRKEVRQKKEPHKIHRITDTRSESRKEFTKIKVNDPKEKLKELPIKMANERRNNIIAENREKRIEDSKISQRFKDSEYIQSMLNEIRETMKEFMEYTNNIENIKKIVELNYK